MLTLGTIVVILDKQSSYYMHLGKITSIASFADPINYGINILSAVRHKTTVYLNEKCVQPVVTNTNDLLANIYRRYELEYLRGLIFAAESVSKTKSISELRSKINECRTKAFRSIEEYVKEVEDARRTSQVV